MRMAHHRVPEFAYARASGRVESIDAPVPEIADQQQGIVAMSGQSPLAQRSNLQPHGVQRSARYQSPRPAWQAWRAVQVDDVDEAVVRTGHVVMLGGILL